MTRAPEEIAREVVIHVMMLDEDDMARCAGDELNWPAFSPSRMAKAIAAAIAADRASDERVRAAVMAEREACAKVASDLEDQWNIEWRRGKKADADLAGMSGGACDVALAIRARPAP